LIKLINNFYNKKIGIKIFKNELKTLKEDRNNQFHPILEITNNLKNLVINYCNSKWKTEENYNNQFVNFIFNKILDKECK
jgi:hypothetical protein